MSFPPFQAIPKLVDLSEIPLDVSLILHPCTFANIYNVRYSDRRMRAAWKSFVTFTSSSFCIMPEMMRWHPVCAQLPLDDSIFDSNRQTLHNDRGPVFHMLPNGKGVTAWGLRCPVFKLLSSARRVVEDCGSNLLDLVGYQVFLLRMRTDDSKKSSKTTILVHL
ncbi:hypothetical protein GQ600_1612 [Phytophthora cactorum]|nr:hypothetical protein GQ600_1612 [Phytophthora cactorum]